MTSKRENLDFDKFSRYINQYTPDGRFIVSYEGNNRISSYMDYIEFYNSSIKALEAQINTSSDPSDDMLVYPILYLCRHTVELCLKLILYIPNSYKEEGEVQVESNHKLLNILFKIRKIDQYQDNELVEHEEIITFLDNLDQLSYSFRYPEDTKRKPNKHNNIQVYWLLDNIMEDLSSLISDIRTRYYKWQETYTPKQTKVEYKI